MEFHNNSGAPPIDAFGNMSLGGNVAKPKKKKHAYHVLDSGIPPVPSTERSVPGGPPDQFNQSRMADFSASIQPAAQTFPLGAPDQKNPQSGANRFAPNSANESMSAIPSLPEDREFAQASLGSAPQFQTFENACPPPACCEYLVQDQGISGPNFARLTMYNVPASEQLRETTKLPLGMLIRPFARPVLGENTVSLADFSASQPPRCRRCRTYMNPSMLFAEGGTRFVCNMCQFSNPVDADYFQPTDSYNRRIDWHERPELAYGTYDMSVPNDYWFEEKKPHPMRYLFAIDVSLESVKKELPQIAAEAIRKTIYGGDFPQNAQIGIITYDRSIHFYNLSHELEQAQMLVMSDLKDPFVPLEEGLFVDPEKSRAVIEQFFSSIGSLFEWNRTPECAYGAVVDVALKALESSGGKLSVVLSSLPTWGPGALRSKAPNDFSSSSKVDLLKPSSVFYQDLAKKYATSGVGMDLYSFSSSFVDVTTTGHIAHSTGGHVHNYANYVGQRDGKKFIADFVKRNIAESGTQCLLKVRCSNGLQVSKYFGNIYVNENHPDSDPFIGCLDADTTIGVLFHHDGKLDTKLDAHFQAALLYTSASGERRVRVVNVLASVSEQFKPVMNYIDVDACVGIITREALSHIGFKPPKEIRVGINEKVIECFSAYRKHAGSNLPPSQLLMPVALRSFIISALSLMKSKAFKEGQASPDTIATSKFSMNSYSADELAVYLYPRIIGLHNLRPDDAITLQAKVKTQKDMEGTDVVLPVFQYPTNIRDSGAEIEDGGVYMVYNGDNLLLFIQKQVNSNLLKDLFGPEIIQTSDLDPYLNELPELETEVSRQARALVSHFAQLSSKEFLGIQLARQDLDGAEHEFIASLVEDRTPENYSYSDYVAYVHRSVKQLIENGNAKPSTQMLNESIGLSTLGI